MYNVTMQITFLTRKFRNGERNLHCDVVVVVHVTTKWVSSLTLECNGVFAIKAFIVTCCIVGLICHTLPSSKYFLEIQTCSSV